MRRVWMPVYVSGNKVGVAEVGEDGTIDISVPANQFGRELFLMAEVGLIDELRLSSRDKPATARSTS